MATLSRPLNSDPCLSPTVAIVEEASNAFRLNMGIFNTIRTPEEPKPETKSTAQERSRASKRKDDSVAEVPQKDVSWPLSSVAAVIAASAYLSLQALQPINL